VTCEEVLDEEYENRYQRAAGFLPVDGEVALEEINMANKMEIAELEMDPFAGLYRMNAATDSDDEYTDNGPDADSDVDEPEGLRVGEGGLELEVQHGDGYCRQPPTIPDARLALEDLTGFLYPQRQKKKAENKLCNTSLDPITRERLEDIRSFLWRYCDFDADGEPQNRSAGSWIQASVDVAGSRTKGSWRARTLRVSARAYVQTRARNSRHTVTEKDAPALKMKSFPPISRSIFKVLENILVLKILSSSPRAMMSRRDMALPSQSP
jgi:hypothetical protein